MTRFIFKPSGNASGDFTGAVDVRGLDPTETAVIPAGTYDILQEVTSNLRVQNALWSPLELESKLMRWCSFTDPLNVFTDVARTMPVTDGAQIRGVTDLSGNGNHMKNDLATAADQYWDETNAQMVFNGQSSASETAQNVYLEDYVGLPGGTADMSMYMLLETTDLNCGLLNAVSGNNRYAGFMLDGGTSFGVTSNMGALTDAYAFDNGPETVSSTKTSNDFSADIRAAGSTCCVFRRLDMRGYTTDSQILRMFNNQSATRPFKASLKHIVQTYSSLTPQEELDLQVWAELNRAVAV